MGSSREDLALAFSEQQWDEVVVNSTNSFRTPSAAQQPVLMDARQWQVEDVSSYAY